MKNNIKFFIKDNKFTLSFLAIFLVIQSIVAVIYTLLNVKFANATEIYYYDSYFWMRVSDYIEMSNFILSVIVILVALFMIGSSCLNNFPKSRRYKASMGDLKFVEYIANPVIIFITSFIVTLQSYTSSIIYGLWSGEQYLGYGVKQYKQLSEYLLNEVTQIMLTMLLVSLIVYFGMLILYKQLTLYTIKYKTVKYKILYSVVHCFAGFMLLIGILYFYTQMLYFNDDAGIAYIGYFIEEIQYVGINVTEHKFTILLNIGFFAILALTALVFYNKCKKLDCDEPSGKKRYILLSFFVVITVIVPSIITKDIYAYELKEYKRITGAESIVSVYATNFSAEDYDKFDKKIDSVLKEYNITDYSVTVDNISFGDLYINTTIYLDDIDEDGVNIALATYNYDDATNLDIIEGNKPINLAEIIIPTEFADYILLYSNNKEYEQIIGKYVQGSKIVGIYDSKKDATINNENEKFYYGTEDNTVFYKVYSNKNFDENSLKIVSEPTNQNLDVFNHSVEEFTDFEYDDGEHFLEYTEGYPNYSSIYIRINVFNEDTDYSSINYFSGVYSENEFDIHTVNIDDFNDWKYLYDYIITISIFAVFILVSVAYIASNKERRGRNV